MPEKKPSENNLTETATDHNWEERRLCSDGNCIGVIGPEGNCKECGKPYRGDTVDEEPLWSDDNGDDGWTETDNPEDGSNESNNPVSADTDMEWENRKLCNDGNCIGVIGPDGNCKECGKPYEPED